MDDNMILGQPLEEGIPPEPQILTDMTFTPIMHSHDRIVGNQLRCSLHGDGDGCPVIFVKPTQVLEQGDDGKLYLVDKG